MVKSNTTLVCDTGHWLEKDVDASLHSIALPKEGPTTGLAADVFLHGFCGIFALAIADTFGYEIEVSAAEPEDKDDTDCGPNLLMDWNIVHIYCVQREGADAETAYIDVRGVTSDEEKFFDDFSDELCGEDDYLIFSTDDIRDFCCSCMSEEGYKSLYAAALAIVQSTPSIYQVKLRGRI